MISTWVSRYVQNVTATLFIEVILTKHILVFLSCGNLHMSLLQFIEVILTKYILVFLCCGNLFAGSPGSRGMRRVKRKDKGGLG